MLKPPLSTTDLLSNDNNNTKVTANLNELNNKETMSGDTFSTWQSPTSSSVTGTSELFGSTYAMLSDHASYPDQWSGKHLTQSILFEQPQIQPLIGNSYGDPPVRFDHPCAYRTGNYMAAMPQLAAAAQYYPQRNGYSTGPQFYSPALTNPQQLIFAQAAAQAANNVHIQQQQQQQQQVLRPEPLRPTVQKNGNGLHRSPSTSSAETLRNNSVSVATVSPSDDNSLNSPALTSSGSAGSGTPPLGSDHNTDLESNDEERVMCMACKGVYPSRRSLTGHIGRNEKCREIIGRNYLDAVANGVNPPIPGTDAAIKSGAITTGTDGMSPVCPYCDRFISHYKGNIRRHINQCCKSAEPIKRHRVEHNEKHTPKKRIKKEERFHHEFDHDSSSMSGGVMNSPKMSSPSSSFYPSGNSTELCSPSEYSSNAYEPYPINGHSPQESPRETAVLQDAYICEDCDFVTVYKGNMKRHLNTCHPQPDCKKWDHKLEGMRASNLGISGDRLQERLAAHKANSSRGRKPRKKKENNTDETEPVDFKNVLSSDASLLEVLTATSAAMEPYNLNGNNNFQPPPPPPPPPMLL